MEVRPPIRLLLILAIFLVQFFLAIIYINDLSSKNVKLSEIESAINEEYAAQGDNQEQVIQNLNDELSVLYRTENIDRVNPEQSIKIRDLATPEVRTNTQETPPNSDTTVVIR